MTWRVAGARLNCGSCSGTIPKGATYAVVTDAQKVRCARCAAAQWGAQAPEPSQVDRGGDRAVAGMSTVSDLVARTLAKFLDVRQSQTGEER